MIRPPLPAFPRRTAVAVVAAALSAALVPALPAVGAVPTPDLGKAEAQWIDRSTVVWKVKATEATSQRLVYAPKGGITVENGALSEEGQWLRLAPGALTDAQKATYPHLKDYPAFTVDRRDRARAQVLAMATAALTQGPWLSQAGTDLLRSKSLDRNSYDSGDWFNAINWDCRDGNGFGRGLPPAADNEDKWPYAKPLLGTPGITPGCAEISGASAAYQDLLRIRTTEAAFRLPSTGAVQSALSFPLSGPDETPGVITMRLGDLVVVFNATPDTARQRVEALAGRAYGLHPVQAGGADATVKKAAYEVSSGTFEVPARTVAVFRAGG